VNGSQHILDALKRHQIHTVFGYPGGCIMPLYDALVAEEENIQHVLCRHEQACALAADGYARASGRSGVCIATSGPGATNLITGVANAHRDSIPMLVITGQVPTSLIGTDAFQETDMLGMTLGIVKHSYLVTCPDDLPGVIEEALRLAESGRPGPVWVDIPKDVLLADIGAYQYSATSASEITEHAFSSHKVDSTPELAPKLRTALEWLREAQRPLLYSGGGISLAQAEQPFRAFASISGLPGVVSLKGIGNPGRQAPHQLGMLGMHGSQAANRAVDACDLLIVIGARMDDRATGALSGFAPNARIIHIDCDPAELNKLKPAHLNLCGELAPLLDSLTDALREQPLTITDWQAQCDQWRRDCGFTIPPMADDRISGPEFIRALGEHLPGDSIIACDVGQHQMWVAQHYPFDHPRHHLTSGGLGTMGYGLPAAIGAQFAQPHRTVVNVSGDGSFMMNVQELVTVRSHNLPLKLVILDNQCLGMVRQQQELFYGNRESQIALNDNPDFCALARACGIPALSVETQSEVATALQQVLAHEGPILLHVAIDRNENVWPIVKPGAANAEMIDIAQGLNQTCIEPKRQKEHRT